MIELLNIKKTMRLPRPRIPCTRSCEPPIEHREYVGPICNNLPLNINGIVNSDEQFIRCKCKHSYMIAKDVHEFQCPFCDRHMYRNHR